MISNKFSLLCTLSVLDFQKKKITNNFDSKGNRSLPRGRKWYEQIVQFRNKQSFYNINTTNGILRPKFMSTILSIVTENWVLNKLNVVDLQSNFHLIWWKTWSEIFLPNPHNFCLRGSYLKTRKAGIKFCSL